MQASRKLLRESICRLRWCKRASVVRPHHASRMLSTTATGDGEHTNFAGGVAGLLGFGAAMTVGAGFHFDTAQCDAPNPAAIASQDFEAVRNLPIDELPIYTGAQVAENDGQNGKPIWMTYGGMVYDVTKFIANHPGGSQKIMEAAGSAIEPFWHLYRQHFASDLPMRLMESMSIGRLDEKDQDAIDEQMEVLEKDDPYAREPLRHKALIVHSDAPMNAEVPAKLITKSYLTPNSLFYIRNHHPVPFLSEKQLADYRLKVDLTAYGRGVVEFSLDDIKKMTAAPVQITVTMQCSGNRRSGFNEFDRTSGTPWGQGAVSTAVFKGVRLLDVLKYAGLEDPIAAEEVQGMKHVRFKGIDGMMGSIHVEKALNPYGDVILAWEMNGEPLPRDHGFPLRVIVPGYTGVRSVKWLDTITLAKTEAPGPYQQGLNYRILPPAVKDAGEVSLPEMPKLTQQSISSGITSIEPKKKTTKRSYGSNVVDLKASGWAFAGGGRNVVRVDVTPDNGETWHTAKITNGDNQRFNRAWAWVFWECDVPNAPINPTTGKVELAAKAIDLAFNVQPESCKHMWNVRGLQNNSWFRAEETVVPPK